MYYLLVATIKVFSCVAIIITNSRHKSLLFGYCPIEKNHLRYNSIHIDSTYKYTIEKNKYSEKIFFICKTIESKYNF